MVARVEAIGDFVEQQQFRAARQCARDEHEAAFAVGQGEKASLGERTDVETLEQRRDATLFGGPELAHRDVGALHAGADHVAAPGNSSRSARSGPGVPRRRRRFPRRRRPECRRPRHESDSDAVLVPWVSATRCPRAASAIASCRPHCRRPTASAVPSWMRQFTSRSTARSPRSRSMRLSVTENAEFFVLGRATSARELTGERAAARGASAKGIRPGESGNGGRGLVGGQACVGFVGRLIGLLEQELEVGVEHAVEQLFDVVQHEVGLLIRVDQVVGPQYAMQIECDARRSRGARGVDGLTAGGKNAGAVRAQATRGANQPEFHRVPVQASQHFQSARASARARRWRRRPG